MELIGSCNVLGYTVEAYFPEPERPDTWTVWVVRDGRVVGEFTKRIEVTSPYGMDHRALAELERFALASVTVVTRREPHGRKRPRRTRSAAA